MFDTEETAAQQKVYAHWESLVQQGTADAIKELVSQGLHTRTPTDGKIQALDCLTRIGTPEAVNGICSKPLCEWMGDFSMTIQNNVVPHQFAALFRIGTKAAETGALRLLETYIKSTFNHDEYMYTEAEMAEDLDKAYNLVKTPFARQMIAKIGHQFPAYAGAARAILIAANDKSFVPDIEDFTGQLAGNIEKNIGRVCGEKEEARVHRAMRDVGPFEPKAAMEMLADIRVADMYGRDTKLAALVKSQIVTLLKSFPGQQKELLKVVALNTDKNYFEEAVQEYLASMKGAKRFATQCELIDIYADLNEKNKIRDFIYSKSPKLIEYGLRKMMTTRDFDPVIDKYNLFRYFPDQVGMIVKMLTEPESPNRDTITTARVLADWKGGKVAREFREYCLAKQTPHAIRQLRHINEGRTAVADLLSLEHPVAYEEMGNLTAQFAVKGAAGLLAKRKVALESGVNDVTLHDGAIRALVEKLATPSTVKEYVSAGQASKLNRVFTQAAEAEIIDARPVLKAALVVQRAQHQLSQAKTGFDIAVEKFELNAARQDFDPVTGTAPQ